ncbi:MAG: ATP-binding protein [Holophagaceae bacterium]|nr:ATP-binding protein [Holophagaceae bacterium]
MAKQKRNAYLKRIAFVLLLVWVVLSIGAVRYISTSYTQFFRNNSIRELDHKLLGLDKTNYSAMRYSSVLETFCNTSDTIRNTLLRNGQSGSATLSSLTSVKNQLNAEVVFILDTHGNVVTNTPPGGYSSEDLAGKNLAFSQYFQEAIEGRSITYPEVEPKRRRIVFASPIREKITGRTDSRVIGVGVVKIDPIIIDAFLSQTFRLPILFVSPDGVVICSNKSGWINKKFQKSNSISQSVGVPGQDFGTIDYQFDLPTVKYDGKRHDVIRVQTPHLRDALGRWDTIELVPFPSHVQIMLCLVSVLIIFAVLLILYLRISSSLLAQERYLAEEQVAEAKEWAELLFSVTPSAVFSVDAGGKITSWNDRCSELTGYTPKEAIGSQCSFLSMPDCFSTCDMRSCNICKHTRHKITQIKHKDGKTLSISMHSDTFCDYSGTVIGGIGCFEEISTNLEAEAELIKARKKTLEVAKTKSEFLANMSHEIRTPMNAILGFARVLERDSSLSELQAKFVGNICTSCKHLLNILDDILDISRIEAGKTGLKQTVFRLAGFFDGLRELFQFRADKKGLFLKFDINENLPKVVLGDEGKLRQVLINLIGNALKFTKSGGVTVIANAVALEDSPELINHNLTYLAFEVHDTGIGISEEDLPQLFDAFKQFGTNEDTGGTGLGLAISKNFIEILGGKLSVESQVDKGSCFSFCIPISNSNEEPTKPATHRITGIKKTKEPIRVLVVDDSGVNRFLINSILVPLGIETRGAADGREAIVEFEAWNPDLILMDMRMPEMSGYEAIRRIKGTPRGSMVPIIAVTASALHEDRHNIMETGANAYLAKPFNREDLLELIATNTNLTLVYDNNMQ